MLVGEILFLFYNHVGNMNEIFLGQNLVEGSYVIYQLVTIQRGTIW